MKKSGDYITAGKRKELESELAHLRGAKRKEILESLEYAKSLGDLSENAEYHQAREEQGKLEARIIKIEQILQHSETVSPSGGDTVNIGSFVTVKKEGDDVARTFQVVGSEEADMGQSKISHRSPFGEAVWGKKKGEKVLFKTPSGGVATYKIIKVT